MRDNTLPSFYVLSGYTSMGDYTDELIKELLSHGYIIQSCDGCYKGINEPAVMVFSDTINILHYIRKYNQESALFVDNQRNGYLFYETGYYEHIGTWREVPCSVALKNNAFTVVKNRYFIVS